MFSVGTEKEAKALLTMACQTNLKGEFIAKELAVEQSIHNLFSFSERLAEIHIALVGYGSCECKEDE